MNEPKSFRRSAFKRRVDFLFRVSLACYAFARSLNDKLLGFLHYLHAGLTVVVLVALAAHPFILWAVLIGTNIEGDLAGNYLHLAVLLTDAALIFFGGIWVQGRAKGEY